VVEGADLLAVSSLIQAVALGRMSLDSLRLAGIRIAVMLFCADVLVVLYPIPANRASVFGTHQAWAWAGFGAGKSVRLQLLRLCERRDVTVQGCGQLN